MPRPLRGLRILYPSSDIVDPHATKLVGDYGFRVAPLGHTVCGAVGAIACLTVFRSARTIAIVGGCGLFGRPQFDTGNVGYNNFRKTVFL